MQCPSCHTSVEGNPPFCPSCGAALPREVGPDPLLGRVFQDKYKIVQLLGEGGMGAVYLGEQALGAHTRRVAIKTLHAHLSKDEQIRQRFQREVGTLATLEHPNTVQVFDFGTSPDGILYIVMEYVQGRSIADTLTKERTIAPERVTKIIDQISGSLAEAHGKGIIHRDLKPDNIVLTERAGQKDFVKVLDFGIAKRSDEADRNEKKLTQQGMVLGTPPYMSPEQFTGQPLDARSDIYSLAVMAYEMLTGELPFEAKTAWEWATLHMTAAPKAIEATPNGAALPASMRGAIMKALAKDKEHRFATVTEFDDRFSGRTQAPPGELALKHATSIDQPGPRPLTTDMPGGAYQAQAASAIAPPVAHAGGDPLKGKTQMGEPIAFPADFNPAAPAPYPPAPGPAGPMGPPMGPEAYRSPANAYAPGAAVPQGPPGRASQSGGRGNKGLILGVAGVVAVLSIGLVAWGAGAFKSSSDTTVPPLDLGSSSGAPTVIATDTAAPVAPVAPVDTSGGAVAPLNPVTPTPATPGPKPTAPKPTGPTPA
ncbi:MAG: Serine/threonine protein kinase PrkC, regulator of stationary phase, partial [Labilithrix sp.]|nr:Serine/threonine protein kinase PrkC, regulator of stationary phase [Labilithrix sp.]